MLLEPQAPEITGCEIVRRLPCSRPEQALAAGVAESLQRALTSRGSVRLQRDEGWVAAQRIELRTAGKRRHRVIPLGHAALEERQAPRVFAHITEQPTFLEDGLRIVLNLQRSKRPSPAGHVLDPMIQPG